jgi:hypothetical protein
LDISDSNKSVGSEKILVLFGRVDALINEMKIYSYGLGNNDVGSFPNTDGQYYEKQMKYQMLPSRRQPPGKEMDT